MAYDPFAPPAPAGRMQTMGVQTPAVMPNPIPVQQLTLDPNNALAGAMTPTTTPGPVMTPSTIPPQLGAQGWQQFWQQFQANPQGFMGNMPSWAQMNANPPGGPQGMGDFDRAGFRTAMGDWRDQRPQFAGGGFQGRQDYRTDLTDWRSQRPQRNTFFTAPTTGSVGG